jgi:hypothetical protein
MGTSPQHGRRATAHLTAPSAFAGGHGIAMIAFASALRTQGGGLRQHRS